MPTIRRTLILQDASNRQVKLTLWGKRASEFDGDQIYENGQSQTMIVLFVGLLMKRYGPMFTDYYNFYRITLPLLPVTSCTCFLTFYSIANAVCFLPLPLFLLHLF